MWQNHYRHEDNITGGNMSSMHHQNDLMQERIIKMEAEIAALKKQISEGDREFLALEAENGRLKAWKDSVMELESTWDIQAVSKALGIQLGQPIHPGILPGIEKLKAENKELKAISAPLWWSHEGGALKAENERLRLENWNRKSLLLRIPAARDYHAEFGTYPKPPYGPGEDQEFDDWAADVVNNVFADTATT